LAFEVKLRSAAVKQFGSLPSEEKKRIAEKIEALKSDSKPNGAKKLKGAKGLWRVRSGRLRVVYMEPDSEGVIEVVKIARRDRVYRGLS
jgi:mRNA-degrading endonuclease RelE of RelBE toxin-antitoxin system